MKDKYTHVKQPHYHRILSSLYFFHFSFIASIAGEAGLAVHTQLPLVVLLGEAGFSKGVILWLMFSVIQLPVKCSLTTGYFLFGKGNELLGSVFGSH